MKKLPDLGEIIIFTLVFWFIFVTIELASSRFSYPFGLLICSLISAITVFYFIHKREKHYEDILKRIQDELEFQQKHPSIDYLDKIVSGAKFLKEKDDELMKDIK